MNNINNINNGFVKGITIFTIGMMINTFITGFFMAYNNNKIRKYPEII